MNGRLSQVTLTGAGEISKTKVMTENITQNTPNTPTISIYKHYKFSVDEA